MSDQDLQQTLDRILNDLKSDDPASCLEAIQELSTLNASSNAIVSQLKKLALTEAPEVQKAALAALSLRTSQFIASKSTPLTRQYRKVILDEIDGWQSAGLIESQRAEMLRRQYDFDIKPALTVQPLKTTPATGDVIAETSPVQDAVQKPSAPPVPRQSLTQTLLSESSIKVYLYLGAFFVIASALILAALVEAARLPILVAATFAFGGGAFIIRRRLPQPGFALFIVFSFLLPIDANVIEETIGFNEPTLSIYWTIVFGLMAFIWAVSVWFYESRFFSIVSFGALSLAFYRLGQVFRTELELQFFLGVVASLIGVAGVSILKKWKDGNFAMPLFLLSLLQVFGLLIISLVYAFIHVAFGADIANGWWLLVTLTWIAIASFFAASDIVFPSFFFPWMVATTLLPLPWFFIKTFEGTAPVYSIGFWFWATLFALISEVSFRLKLETFKKYHWALLSGSLPLFIISISIALDLDQPALTFLLLAGTMLVYGLVHFLRQRIYVWSVALLYGLAAYFAFFTMPTIDALNISPVYQFLGATLLLTTPELLFRKPLAAEDQSRLPAIVLGAVVLVCTVALAIPEPTYAGRSAIVFLVFAMLFALHAFHFNRPWIGYFACAMEILTIVYGLHYFELDLWLPALTLLSLLYYATGFFLRRTETGFKQWGEILINSGLGLGLILAAASLILLKETAGWYIILVALLFAVEVFARPLGWLEIFVEGLLTLSLYLILHDFNVPQLMDHFLFGATLIWLGGDLLFSRFIEKRLHRPITAGFGFLFVFTSTLSLLTSFNGIMSVLYFVGYAMFFAFYAFAQRKPRLGYFVTAFIPLAVIKFYEYQNYEKWIFPLIVLAVMYYAIGFVLRRYQAKEWASTLIYSGLGLGVLTSIAAPLQGGLSSSIPVAIAATLFAAEAFALRNVWWALPADALYLMSYFMILAELNVEEPQYYSIGAALLGMVMHYLLVRAGSKTGAFIAGMLSQLILLGTTYIQMVSNSELKFFFVLFAQSMVILIYGLVLRSRSLVITPIVFAVVGVITVVYSALKGLSSVILVGCTGIVLLLVGIGAVLLRERITKLGEQLSDWKP